MNGIPEQVGEEKITEINGIVSLIAPNLNRMVSLLKESGVTEFEIVVDGEKEKLVWTKSSFKKPEPPTQLELANELNRILDEHFPANKGFTFMSMIWNPNRAIAENMAAKVAEYRKRDRAQVESQIIALLGAFKQGV